MLLNVWIMWGFVSFFPFLRPQIELKDNVVIPFL